MSKLEEKMAFQMRVAGLPNPEREFRFDLVRRWRFDFAWPDKMVALEVDGGTWSRGAHSRGKGQRRDAEKQNAAHLLGWTVYRATSDMVKDGTALNVIEEALK